MDKKNGYFFFMPIYIDCAITHLYTVIAMKTTLQADAQPNVLSNTQKRYRDAPKNKIKCHCGKEMLSITIIHLNSKDHFERLKKRDYESEVELLKAELERLRGEIRQPVPELPIVLGRRYGQVTSQLS
jgi:hypothetical protein